MGKDCLIKIKDIWMSLTFFEKVKVILLVPFAFIANIFYEICNKIKNDIVDAACQPMFFDAFVSILELFVKYIGIVVITTIIVSFVLFIILLLLAIIIEFPWISLSIVGFFALIIIGVKVIRNYNSEKVAQAKEEYDERISGIMKKYKNKYIQSSET